MAPPGAPPGPPGASSPQPSAEELAAQARERDEKHARREERRARREAKRLKREKRRERLHAERVKMLQSGAIPTASAVVANVQENRAQAIAAAAAAAVAESKGASGEAGAEAVSSASVHSGAGGESASAVGSSGESGAASMPLLPSQRPLRHHPIFGTFFALLDAGVARDVVQQEMQDANLDIRILELDPQKSLAAQRTTLDSNPTEARTATPERARAARVAADRSSDSGEEADDMPGDLPK